MRQPTPVVLAFALILCCGAALGSTAIRNFGPFGNGASVAGVASNEDGTRVVLADSTSGAVLLGIAVDNSVVRAVQTGLFHAKSLTKIASGFLLVGTGRADIPWLLKVNDRFEVMWAEAFDGDFRPEAVCGTNDGSIYLGGYRDGDIRTAALMKLAGDGSVLWRRTVHGSSHFEQIVAVQATKDGVVAAGSTECGASLWKTLSDGTFSWQRCFGFGSVSRFMAVTSLDDGEIVAAGHDDAALIVAKTNSAGLFRWKNSITSSYLADANDIVRSKHQIVVIGTAKAVNNTANLIAVAFSFDGKPLWQRSYGSPQETSAIALSSSFSRRNAAPDGEGGVVVGVGIGNYVRMLRLGGDGYLDDDCSGVANASLSFTPSAPVGQSIAVETSSFEAGTHRLQTATFPATVSSTPVCSAAPQTAAISESQPKPQPNQRQDTYAIVKQIADVLMARKFSELDALADEWRRTHARLEPLSPKLIILYDTVAGQTVAAQVGEDAQEKLLKEWIAARPSSPTAVLALGRFYTIQAGARRGTSITASDKGNAEFIRYTDAAMKVLKEHRDLAEVDPQYYAILINATMDGSQYFQAGNAQSDHDVIGAASILLLPQWGGTVEQYDRLMEIAVEKTKADLGQTEYARLALRLTQYACCDDRAKLWETYHLDWNRIKQGFLDFAARSPYTTPLHRLAMMAYSHKDRATLAEVLSRPEVKWDDVAQAEWGSRATFDEARAWAFPKVSDLGNPSPAKTTEQAAAPVTPMGPRTWPEVLLDSDVTLMNGEHRRIWAFLVKGQKGVMAVSSVEPFRSNDSQEKPIAQARQQIASWKLQRPAEPRRNLTVSGYITPMTSYSRGVLLAIPGFTGEPIRRALEVGERSTPFGSKVYVAACPRSEASCKQRIYEGTLNGGGSGNNTNGALASKWFEVEIDGISPNDAIGAPVLDEGGFAIGVVVGKGGTVAKQTLKCDDLSFLVTGR